MLVNILKLYLVKLHKNKHSKHPKVISGEITQEQAFDEFSRNFNDHTGAGKIQLSEWNDYYAAVSASVDNDQHFISLLKSTWQIE